MMLEALGSHLEVEQYNWKQRRDAKYARMQLCTVQKALGNEVDDGCWT